MSIIIADPNTADSAGDLIMRLNAQDAEAWRRDVYFDDAFVATQYPPQGADTHRQKLWGDDEVDADYTSPGEAVEGGANYADYVDWTVDRPLKKVFNLDAADLTLAYWDPISKATMRSRRDIRRARDKVRFQLLLLAARTASVSNVHSGGNVVETHAASHAAAYPVTEAGADALIDDIAELAYMMDNDYAPGTGRNLYITAYGNRVLQMKPQLLSKDYQDPGNASMKDRYIGTISSFNIIVVPDGVMPSTNINTGLSKYQVNASLGASSQRRPIALAAMTGSDGAKPIGRVVKWDLTSKIYYDEDVEAWVVKSLQMDGLGVFAPWCAGEIGVSSS